MPPFFPARVAVRSLCTCAPASLQLSVAAASPRQPQPSCRGCEREHTDFLHPPLGARLHQEQQGGRAASKHPPSSRGEVHAGEALPRAAALSHRGCPGSAAAPVDVHLCVARTRQTQRNRKREARRRNAAADTAQTSLGPRPPGPVCVHRTEGTRLKNHGKCLLRRLLQGPTDRAGPSTLETSFLLALRLDILGEAHWQQVRCRASHGRGSQPGAPTTPPYCGSSQGGPASLAWCPAGASPQLENIHNRIGITKKN